MGPARREGPRARPVTDGATLTKLWADLSGEPARAYAATWELAGGGTKAVELLRGHLRPAPPPDVARVRKLLADLASDEFSVREAAAKALAKFGRPVEPALRQRLADKPSADLRKRLESILAQVRAAPPPEGSLRDSRAVQALELIGSAEARALLKQLASGEPTSPLTRTARLALARLERRLK